MILHSDKMNVKLRFCSPDALPSGDFCVTL